MKSYLNIYSKAKKYYDTKQVQIVEAKENGQEKYFFTVKNYKVTLTLEQVNKVWIRNWACSCNSYAMKNNLVCSHVMACEYFLINNSSDKQ